MTTPRLNANLQPEDKEKLDRLRDLIEEREFKVTKVKRRISLAAVIRVAISHAVAMEEMIAAQENMQCVITARD